jgi:hypothetical protein
MATGRIAVERALLISTISDLNKAEIAQYEKDLKVYEKDMVAQDKRVQTLALKVAKIIGKAGVKDLDLRNDYDWSNGRNGSERVEYVRVQLELTGIDVEDLGGTFRTGSLNKPSDPCTHSHGKFYEREQMLKTLALTTKDEISLPINWSEQYL